MSAFLLGMGFKADMGTCVRKLVLLKLIDACEEDGSRIFPAVATVARAAQCSARQVQRELKAFVDCGLIRLVREGGKGPKSTNEYAMDLDLLSRIAKEGWAVVVDGAAMAKGDTVSPLDEGEKGDTGDSPRVTPETPKGDKLSHPTPPYPSIDPSERESAQARDGIGEGQDGEGEAQPEAPSASTERRRFETRVKRTGRGWPGWETSSTKWAVGQFEKLDEADRQAAERHAAAYVAHCNATKGLKAVPLGVYFRDRKWTDLPASALMAVAKAGKPAAATTGDELAPPFGPLWMAAMLKQLVTGPKAIVPPLTWIEQGMVDDGKADANRLMLAKQAKAGWPGVNFMIQRARSRSGVVVADTLLPLAALTEPVPVGSACFEDWRSHFDAMGWPWLPDPGDQPVVYFPKGGPFGLADFETALAEMGNGHDGDRRQAAE